MPAPNSIPLFTDPAGIGLQSELQEADVGAFQDPCNPGSNGPLELFRFLPQQPSDEQVEQSRARSARDALSSLFPSSGGHAEVPHLLDSLRRECGIQVAFLYGEISSPQPPSGVEVARFRARSAREALANTLPSSGGRADFACFQDALGQLGIQLPLLDAQIRFDQLGGTDGLIGELEFVGGFVNGNFLMPHKRPFHLAQAEVAFRSLANGTDCVCPHLFDDLLQRALGVLLPPWFRIDRPVVSSCGIRSAAFREWYVRTIEKHGGSVPGFVFCLADKKQSGFLDLMAFDRALRMLGVFLETEEADGMFLNTVKGDDRGVSLSEFLALYDKTLVKLRGIGAIAGNAFAAVDDERNGFIGKEEFQKVLDLLSVRLEDIELDSCFQKADVSQRGRLTQKQFVDFFDEELFWRNS